MRTLIISIFLLSSLIVTSQSGLNYQATVNDSDGNLIKNTNVSLRFTISNQTQPSSDSSTSYVETHQVNIGSDGIINIIIGQGNRTSLKVFSEIDWSDSPIYMQREVDNGQGYVIAGSSAFNSVPIAEYAKNSAGINGINITGNKTAIGDQTLVGPLAPNSTAIGFGAVVDTPNTIQLGSTMVSTVTTSGIVSATGFVGGGFTGDGSGLTNINPNGGINGINITDNKIALGFGASVLTSNTIQLGNKEVTSVRTSGIVSATAFIGDGSGLTNIGGASFDTRNNMVYNGQIPSTPSLNIVPTDNPSTNFNEATGSSADNIMIGDNSGYALTTGYSNIALGKSALNSVTSSFYNIALGPNALEDITTVETSGLNIAIGANALSDLNNGFVNIALGTTALRRLQTGIGNIGIGAGAIQELTTGSGNTGVGMDALNMIYEAYANTAFGHSAGFGSQGSSNTLMGYEAAYQGYYNATNTLEEVVAIGYQSLYKPSNLNDGAVSIGYESMKNYLKGGSYQYTFTDIASTTVDETEWNISASTAVGYQALKGSDENGGSFNTGLYNTALGHKALTSVSSGSFNVAVGSRSLMSNTSGIQNTAIGDNAMSENTTGKWNVALGTGALKNNISGFSSTAIGLSSLGANTTGVRNVALGVNSLKMNTTGSANVAIGHSALRDMSGTGTATSLLANGFEYGASTDNTAVGKSSMENNSEGSFNTALGAYSLQNNSTGFNNVAIGLWTLNENDEGIGNTALGWGALQHAEDSSGNTALGSHAGQFLGDGSVGNTFIGENSGPSSESNSTTILVNSTTLGRNADVNESNSMSFGNEFVGQWSFGRSGNDDGKALQVGSGTFNGNGAYLSDGGVWTNASSIAFKTNFISLSSASILDKIKALEVMQWKYKGTEEYHIGPFAEQFKELFSLGVVNDNEHISTMDIAGVALKGIQALELEVSELKKINQKLEQKNKLLASKMEEINKKLDLLLQK